VTGPHQDAVGICAPDYDVRQRTVTADFQRLVDDETPVIQAWTHEDVCVGLSDLDGFSDRSALPVAPLRDDQDPAGEKLSML
jgi:hypothetical protein